MIRFFLSFAQGRWMIPILPTGFGKNDNKIWEQLSTPSGEPWSRNVLSWWAREHSDQLIESFPGFVQRWQNDDWKDTIHEALSWYFEANSSHISIEAKIILTQAAIELISFEHVVKSKRLIEKEGFKRLRASDKFRLLLSSLGIPIDLPKQLPKLIEEATRLTWMDGPHALTEVRNSIVHPEHKRRGQLDSILLEAWNLGLWYLELSLLSICNYRGTYANRMILPQMSGKIDPVPWVHGIPRTENTNSYSNPVE